MSAERVTALRNALSRMPAFRRCLALGVGDRSLRPLIVQAAGVDGSRTVVETIDIDAKTADVVLIAIEEIIKGELRALGETP